MPRTLVSATAYIDDQDTENPGWAYKLWFDDDHCESDAMDATTRSQARSELRALIESYGRTDVVIGRDDAGDLAWSADG